MAHSVLCSIKGQLHRSSVCGGVSLLVVAHDLRSSRARPPSFPPPLVGLYVETAPKSRNLRMQGTQHACTPQHNSTSIRWSLRPNPYIRKCTACISINQLGANSANFGGSSFYNLCESSRPRNTTAWAYTGAFRAPLYQLEVVFHRC